MNGFVAAAGASAAGAAGGGGGGGGGGNKDVLIAAAVAAGGGGNLTRRAPHSPQNWAPSRVALPQLGQVMLFQSMMIAMANR
jgi:hypothetical protein